MEQLDKWNKEMRRLSVAKFAETDDALYNFYKESLKSLKVEVKQYIDEYDTLSFSKRLEVDNRLKTANRIDEILTILNKWSDSEIRSYIEKEIEVGYYGTWYAMEGAENLQLDFGMLNEDYIKTLVNKPVDGSTFSKRLYQHQSKLAESVTAELLNGAVSGKGYAVVAKNIGEQTESSYKQALRIARTEGGRAQSASKQKAYKEAEEKGVQMQKRWLSTLDKKTRHSHQELDGQTVDVDEKFLFDGHKAEGPRMFGRASLDINCRCTTIAVVNGVAPALRKDNLTGERIEYTNYNDWFNSKRTQNVIGKKKYEDYVSKLSKKYGTNNFSKLLDRMTEKEYEQLNILDVTGMPEDIPLAVKSTFDAKAIMSKTNMIERVGEANYNSYVDHLDAVKDERIRNLYAKIGSDIEFRPLKDGRAFASGNVVQVAQGSFDGGKWNHPLQTVYHENGHALDSLGMKTLTGEKSFATGKKVKVKMLGRTVELDETVHHASGLPEYNLKETIERDLWKYVNGDLPMRSDLGKKPRKAAEKAAWEEASDRIIDDSKVNFTDFKASMLSIKADDPRLIGNISDIVESTGWLGEYPFGLGHGKKYWKTAGTAETEFFAHFTEALTTNADSYELLKGLFPESMKICEQIIDDIIKKAGD